MVPDSGEFRIRVANAADADVFAEERMLLYQSLGHLAPGANLAALRRETRASLQESLELDTGVVWLSSNRSGDVVGSAALLIQRRFPSVQNPSRREAYLGHMFVHSGARRRGIGSSLLRAALDESRRRGLVRMRLHSTESGLELYRRFGFQMRSNDMEIFL